MRTSLSFHHAAGHVRIPQPSDQPHYRCSLLSLDTAFVLLAGPAAAALGRRPLHEGGPRRSARLAPLASVHAVHLTPQVEGQVASTLLADAEEGVALPLAHVLGRRHALGVRGVPEEVAVPLCVPAGVAVVQEGAVLTDAPRHELCVREALRADVERRGAGLLATVLPLRVLVALARVAARADAPVLLHALAAAEVAAGLHHGLLDARTAPVGLHLRLGRRLTGGLRRTHGAAVGVPRLLHLCAVEVVHAVALVLGHDELCAVVPAEEVHGPLAVLVRHAALLGRLLERRAGGLCAEQHARAAAAVGGPAGLAGRRDLWGLGRADVAGAVLLGPLHGLCRSGGRLGRLQSRNQQLGVLRRLLLPAPDALAGRLGVEEQSGRLVVVCALGPLGELLCCGRLGPQLLHGLDRPPGHGGRGGDALLGQRHRGRSALCRLLALGVVTRHFRRVVRNDRGAWGVALDKRKPPFNFIMKLNRAKKLGRGGREGSRTLQSSSIS